MELQDERSQNLYLKDGVRLGRSIITCLWSDKVREWEASFFQVARHLESMIFNQTYQPALR